METCTNMALSTEHGDKIKSKTTSSNLNQETSSNNIGPKASDQHTECETDTSANSDCNYLPVDNKSNMNDDSNSVNDARSDDVSVLKHAQAGLQSTTTGKAETFTNVKTDSSLSQLLDYGLTDSDSDSRDTATDSEVTTGNGNENNSTNNKDKSTLPKTEFRNNSSDSSSTFEYESDSNSSYSDIGARAVTPIPEKKTTPKGKMNSLRTRGELSIENLPPIEELKISVPEEECMQMGIISSIIDQLVIVQSLPGLPAYDIDTVLFLNAGKQTLGKVFDVLRPVAEPFYAVRFNSYEQVIETGAKPGIPVYCAPARHASYVFVSELMKIKGSDAPWEHNNEPPVMFLDISDDEKDHRARRVLRNRGSITADTHKSNSLERNKKFEKQMNDKNLLMNEYFNRVVNSQQSGGKKPTGTVRLVAGRGGRGGNVGTAWEVPRPELWPAPAYQFGYQYRPVPVFPNVGVGAPWQACVPPPAVFHTPAMPFNPTVPPPMPFNPTVPPPMLAAHPQPLAFHPRWVSPPIGVLQPRPKLDHSPYTQ